MHRTITAIDFSLSYLSMQFRKNTRVIFYIRLLFINIARSSNYSLVLEQWGQIIAFQTHSYYSIRITNSTKKRIIAVKRCSVLFKLTSVFILQTPVYKKISSASFEPTAVIYLPTGVPSKQTTVCLK